MSSIYLKIHRTSGAEIVCLCDKEILGKKFEQGEFQLEIKKSFYGGEFLPEKKILDSLEKASSINAVGEKTMAFLLSNNLVQKEEIRKICNIPFANIFRV
jgi:hypothetical protein